MPTPPPPSLTHQRMPWVCSQVPNWLRRALDITCLKGPHQEMWMARSILDTCSELVQQRLQYGEDMSVDAIAQTLDELLKLYEEERVVIAASVTRINAMVPPCAHVCVD